MSTATSSAPGKVILFGEHAVVYGRPAIGAPLEQLNASATITSLPGADWDSTISAADVGLNCPVSELPAEHPLRLALENAFQSRGKVPAPAVSIRIRSTIPVAAGLGSGAAVSAALIRAVGELLGEPFTDREVSDLTFESEKMMHGSPSGIDNTIIAYRRLVYFQKNTPLEFLRVSSGFSLVVADTGVRSSTKDIVADVRRHFTVQPDLFESLFTRVGAITEKARRVIESGDPFKLGPLMNENHEVLQQIGVSSPELDALVTAALKAGAPGAKLCGAGRGGNMIALVREDGIDRVSSALQKAGAIGLVTARFLPTPTGGAP